MGKQPFSGGKPQRRYKGQTTKHRKNDRIRVPQVRLISPDGNQLGVVATKEALNLAKQHGLDLVEVSPSARPPVCRILDFGKYMYELSKKQKDNKSTTTKLKEVKFRINIDEHDYITKLRRAESFLNKSNKLKITLMFRGREMEHTDIGMKIVKRAVKDLEHIGHADADPRQSGRQINVNLSPLPASRRKLKFLSESEADDEPVDDDS